MTTPNNTSRTIWTKEMDDYLLSLWERHPIDEIGRKMSLSRRSLWTRARQLGLNRDGFAARRNQPTDQEWIAAATYRANEGGLKPHLVIAGVCRRQHAIARWKAWQDLMHGNPAYTLAGVGRATGFDHTSIRYGLGRLREITAGVGQE